MNDIIEKLKYNYKNGDITIRLIFICVGVFLVCSLVNFIFFKNSVTSLDDFFGMSSGLESFLKRPWGFFTYLFFHGNLMHLLINMLMLYYIGQLFLRYFRSNDFLTFFFGGAVFGALAFIALAGLLRYNGTLVGASAAVYAIFFGLVAYVPKTKVQLFLINFNIPLDYVGYALLAFDVFSIFSGNNSGGHISHLGGAAFGFLYMKQFEKGNDFLGQFFRKIFTKQKKTKFKVHKTPPRDDFEFNGEKLNKQKEIDKILDKISRSGYESLSKEEKDTLFNAGKN